VFDNGRLRAFTAVESRKLSSFNDDFEFIGHEKEKIDRIGNCVPPKFMQAIAENIKINILDKYYNA
jgi:DNA (cytosine-5)-methyltransferase 1